MKRLLPIAIFLIGITFLSYAQVSDAPVDKRILLAPTIAMTGLMGDSYLQVSSGKEPLLVNRPIFIIYNHKYCTINIGGKVTFLKVDETYTRELIDGYTVESFISGEGNETPRGWYSIYIQHKKNQTTLTINLPMVPDGFAYIVDHARVFSENGEVNNKLHVKNWKEIEAKIRTRDSIAAVEYAIKQEKLRIQDSLYQVDFKKRTISQTNNGDNNYDLYFKNPQEFELLKRKMKVLKDSLLKDNLMGYPIVVHVDTAGKIVECTAKANWYNYAMPKLNEYFLSNPYFVSPYKYIGDDIARRGTKYPAYIEVK